MMTLRNLQLPRVVQSPMANCTNLAFRLIGRALGMRFAYLEMISAEALLRNNAETTAMMATTPEDRPVGAQLVGCDPGSMGEAAARVEDLGFTLVDINLGCPVPKVVGKGGGSQLLREPDTARAIFSSVVRSVTRVPVTVKMRLGYTDGSGEEAARIAQIAESCGVSAIAVHGRTREQGYTGQANYEAIGRVKRAVSIPVYGNGDVTDVASAQRLLDVSGCDGVMLGRGALGNPWIYEEIDAALSGRPLPAKPTVQERKAVLLRHMELEARYEREPVGRAFRDARHSLVPKTGLASLASEDGAGSVGPLRRIICWYFRDVPGVRQFRDAINRAQSLAEMRDLVEAFVP